MTHRGEPTQAYDFDEENSNTSANPTFDSVLGARLSRRGLLRGGVATAGAAVLGAFSLSACGGSDDPVVPAEKLLGFTAVGKSLADKLVIPAGYTASVVYALGDPLQAGVAGYKNDGTDTDYDKRAGDHHDGMEWFGLGADGKRNDSSVDRGLLGMNHEATTDEKLSSFFLHANGGTSTLPRPASEVDKELAIHGVSVVEMRKTAGKWAYVQDSAFNFRITTLTDIDLSGPARGNALMVTKYSTDGTRTRGTLNNCGTGKTPWGTLLTGEENWNGYFFRSATDDAARGNDKSVTALKRYGRPQGAASRHGWETGGADDKYLRWNNSKTGASADGSDDYRNEMNAQGYIVEIDPYNKARKAKKRTGLGRFAHESAAFGNAVAGQPLAVYMGDDARNEYIYKWVSAAAWSAADATAADALAVGDKYLDSGKLYVARFKADGTGEWVELSINNAQIKGYAGYAFADQADVCVNARLAADAVGATKMDRPEWCSVNPANGEIYYTLTNNSNRSVDPSGSSQLAPRRRQPACLHRHEGHQRAKGQSQRPHRAHEGRRRRLRRHQLHLGRVRLRRPGRCRWLQGQPFQPDGRPGLLQPRRPGLQPRHGHPVGADRRRRLHRCDQLHDAGGPARQGGRRRQEDAELHQGRWQHPGGGHLRGQGAYGRYAQALPGRPQGLRDHRHCRNARRQGAVCQHPAPRRRHQDGRHWRPGQVHQPVARQRRLRRGQASALGHHRYHQERRRPCG
jgi:secreted PhoX family phosphatase